MIVYAHIAVPIQVDDKFQALKPEIRKALPQDLVDDLEYELLEIYENSVTFNSKTVPDFDHWKAQYCGVTITDDSDEEEVLVQI